MKHWMLVILSAVLGGCATVNEQNNYGFNIGPGMQEDAQDHYNTKYNMMDSSDGRSDPNAYMKVWGATY